MSNLFEGLINEKLESFQANLIEKIDQKFIHVQELTKLASKVLPANRDGSNTLPLYEILIKFNQFLNANTEIAQQIATQFNSFLSQEIRYDMRFNLFLFFYFSFIYWIKLKMYLYHLFLFKQKFLFELEI